MLIRCTQFSNFNILSKYMYFPRSFYNYYENSVHVWLFTFKLLIFSLALQFHTLLKKRISMYNFVHIFIIRGLLKFQAAAIKTMCWFNNTFLMKLTLSLPSRLAAPPELILEIKTPSSVWSRGLPRWALSPPLICIPSFSPSAFTIFSSYDRRTHVTVRNITVLISA